MRITQYHFGGRTAYCVLCTYCVLASHTQPALRCLAYCVLRIAYCIWALWHCGGRSVLRIAYCVYWHFEAFWHCGTNLSRACTYSGLAYTVGEERAGTRAAASYKHDECNPAWRCHRGRLPCARYETLGPLRELGLPQEWTSLSQCISLPITAWQRRPMYPCNTVPPPSPPPRSPLPPSAPPPSLPAASISDAITAAARLRRLRPSHRHRLRGRRSR